MDEDCVDETGKVTLYRSDTDYLAYFHTLQIDMNSLSAQVSFSLENDGLVFHTMKPETIDTNVNIRITGEINVSNDEDYVLIKFKIYGKNTDGNEDHETTDYDSFPIFILDIDTDQEIKIDYSLQFKLLIHDPAIDMDLDVFRI